MSCPRPRSLAALLAGVLAGCGSGGAATRDGPRHARAGGPCRAAARAAVGAGTTTRVTAVYPGQATCVYTSGPVQANVTVDGNPQAFFRFERTVVEWGQIALWSHHHSHLPLQVYGIGQGADWFPADKVLIATDGKRLVTVKFVRAPRRALKLGKALAKITLTQAR